MGTASKIGWNERCTVRGPVGNYDLARAMNICLFHDGQKYSRADRQWAMATIRKQIKHIRTHIGPEDWGPTSQLLLKVSYLFDRKAA